MGSVHCPSSTSVHEKKQRLLPRTQTVQLRTREMRRFTTTETITVTITNVSLLHWLVDTWRHMRHCVEYYDGMYPLDRPFERWQQHYSTTKGQGVIRIRGTTWYYSTINTRRRYIARTRDEEDTKVRHNDQHWEDHLYCEEEWRRDYWRGTTPRYTTVNSSTTSAIGPVCTWNLPRVIQQSTLWGLVLL